MLEMGLPNESQGDKGDISRKMLIPTTRDVLKCHLEAKVRSLQPGKEVYVVGQLIRDESDQSIIRLLCDSELLRKRIEEVLNCHLSNVSVDIEELGEQLFPKVASIDSELCAQITGMLLELDAKEIRRLLDNPSDLALAIVKAKVEYVRFAQKSISGMSPREKPDLEQTRNDLGETLYLIIASKYPQHASQITGMLLEMDYDALLKLVDSPSQLDEKIHLSYQALHSDASK